MLPMPQDRRHRAHTIETPYLVHYVLAEHGPHGEEVNPELEDDDYEPEGWNSLEVNGAEEAGANDTTVILCCYQRL